MINRITFGYNWNGKLDCDYYTTIRLHNPKKWKVGDIKEVWLKQGKEWEQLDSVEILAVKTFSLEKLTDWIAYLDTGYNRAHALKIFRNMYKQENPEMDFILCKKIKKQHEKTTRREPLIRKYTRG